MQQNLKMDTIRFRDRVRELYRLMSKWRHLAVQRELQLDELCVC